MSLPEVQERAVVDVHARGHGQEVIAHPERVAVNPQDVVPAFALPARKVLGVGIGDHVGHAAGPAAQAGDVRDVGHRILRT